MLNMAENGIIYERPGIYFLISRMHVYNLPFNFFTIYLSISLFILLQYMYIYIETIQNTMPKNNNK